MSSSLNKLAEAQLQLQVTAKGLKRQAAKARKDATTEKNQLKKEIERGNHEVAKTHAANSIRKTKEHQDLLVLASRIEAMASRLQTAITMRQVSEGMKKAVRNMKTASDVMDLDKISQIMDEFQNQSENVEVASKHYEGAMDQTTATSTPQEDVDRLISQVADEAGVELKQQMETATPSTMPGASEQREEELGERLRRLRA